MSVTVSGTVSPEAISALAVEISRLSSPFVVGLDINQAIRALVLGMVKAIHGGCDSPGMQRWAFQQALGLMIGANAAGEAARAAALGSMPAASEAVN